jgi:hypothetical protein
MLYVLFLRSSVFPPFDRMLELDNEKLIIRFSCFSYICVAIRYIRFHHSSLDGYCGFLRNRLLGGFVMISRVGGKGMEMNPRGYTSFSRPFLIGIIGTDRES